MDHGLENSIALNSFKSCLLKKNRFGNDGFQFKGLITYNAINKTFTEVLDVYLIIGGYEPGVRLDIYDKGTIIKSDKFHFDFYIRYDNLTFKYNEELHSLTIDGVKSPKLGTYKVTIEEYTE